MQTESALGAHGESFAGAPTGFRRLTPGLLAGRPHWPRALTVCPRGCDRARPGAGRPQGGGAAAGAFAAPGARHRLAVQIHPAAGLGEGSAADRLALGLAAAGGARPVGNAR